MDTGAVNQSASSQAQQAVEAENAAVNGAATAQQTENVRAALEAAGVSPEEQAVVLANLQGISVPVQTSVSVDVSGNIPDNSAVVDTLNQVQSGLVQVKAGVDQMDMNAVQAQIGQLVDGAQSAADGAADLSSGLTTLKASAAPLKGFSAMAGELQGQSVN